MKKDPEAPRPNEPAKLSLLSAVLGGEPLTRRRALLHLSGLLAGGVGVLSATGLTACGDAGRQPGQEGSRAFSDAQREIVAALADLLIPATDTPGAKAVGVPRFLEVVVREGLSAADRKSFLAGVDEVDVRARHDHGRGFLDCTIEQQRSLASALDEEAFAPPTASAARGGGEGAEHGSSTTFWRILKRLTLVGYYTSEIGATQELRYVAVPGRFEGCVPFASVGRTWAV